MVKDGYFYGAAFWLAAVALAYFTGDWRWGIIPALLAVFFLWFFRDPRRAIPAGAGLIVSPGDGVVTETVAIDTPEGKHQRISIFLSVFNVHVNRVPISGEVVRLAYKKGLYLNAMNPESAKRNEQTHITIRGEGIDVTFKQIAGLLARRIVCNLVEGQQVKRGERMGLIKFGSRVDVIVPGDAEIVVKKGDKVSGGSSVLARQKSAGA